MKRFRKPVTEVEMLDRLEKGEVVLPPFALKIRRDTVRGATGSPDVVLELSWGGREHLFALECKASATPAKLEMLLQQARRASRPPLLWPMVYAPYLSEENLRRLEREGVSGLDLCGNGVIVVPGEWLVCRTGKPNLYPQSFPIKNVFRGVSSLVARVFLLRPTYGTVGEIRKEIKRLGGAITLSTVSKAVARLQDELIVSRQGGEIRLLQPAKLLQRLVENYRPPEISRRFLGKAVSAQPASLLDDQRDWTKLSGVSLAFTGISSADQYVSMPRDPTISVYCSDVVALLDRLGRDNIREQERFFDLELLETDDPSVYFAVNWKKIGFNLARNKAGLFPFASCLQTYMELATGGKRERETAEQLKQSILPAASEPVAG